MEREIRIKYVPLHMALVARRHMAAEQAAEVIPAAFAEIIEHVESGGAVGAEETMVIFPPDFGDPGEHDIEIAVTIADGVPGPGIHLEELPPGEVASLLHVGPYEGTERSWEVLLDWVARSGREPAGPCREIYLNSPDDVPECELETELQVPLL